MNKRPSLVLGLITVLSFLSGGWLLHRGAASGGAAYQRARVFESVVAHVEGSYVDTLAEAGLYDMAIDGLLSQLHDPYSVLLRGDDFRDLTLSATGNYGGIGIQIDVRDGWITVVAPLPETPAERAGVRTGDRVIAVDDSSTRNWSPDRATNALRGDAGTKIRLTVARAGVAAPLQFDLTRAEIHVHSVQFGMVVAPGVGYVQLTIVSDSSARELTQAIDTLRAQGAKSVILDLRNNPGGLLNEGIAVAELFLDKGQTIVETHGRAPGTNESFAAAKGQRWAGLPLVVLVNEGTASAAEIIAGALQDHDRAVLVGTTSFGKGLVQSLFPLGANEALKLTTSRWYTPSGRSIQRIHEDDRGVSHPPVAGAATDTAPRFHTDGGRLMSGGGGIRPDLVVASDSLTVAERRFIRVLGAGVTVYRDVLTAYALDLKARGAVTSPAFAVTPAMVQQVRGRLATRGVTLADSVWRGAMGLVGEQLGYETARYAFGRQDEFRRTLKDDAQLQRAIVLLADVRSPAALLRRARP
jgi:carboxyl-terminal processing protease